MRRTLLALLLAAGPAVAPAVAQPAWVNSATTPPPAAAPDSKPAATAFGAPVALFTQEKAMGYGMYQARANNHYKNGESLLFYLEPVGYAYRKEGDLYRFGMSVDLRLVKNGTTMFSKDGFLNAAFTSHHENKEINFTGNVDVSGAPAGEYRMELKLRDTYSDGVTTVTLPFFID